MRELLRDVDDKFCHALDVNCRTPLQAAAAALPPHMLSEVEHEVQHTRAVHAQRAQRAQQLADGCVKTHAAFADGAGRAAGCTEGTGDAAPARIRPCESDRSGLSDRLVRDGTFVAPCVLLLWPGVRCSLGVRSERAVRLIGK